MDIVIAPMADSQITSFRACLDVVAREKQYLALIEAPPLSAVQAFVRANLASDAVQFVALDADHGGRVIGWADVLAARQHPFAHRGSLGIGILPEYRGRGIGSRLLAASISKAWSKGMTRIELEARSDNSQAIKLYEKFGFVREAVKSNAMLFDNVYYDSIQMYLLEPGIRR